MQAFEWANAKTAADAVRLLGKPTGDFDEVARPIGGGQDLHTTMKAYISRPPRVVNLKTIPGLAQIAFAPDAGLTIGATATLTDVAEHADVLKAVPGLAEAIHSVATPQIRNVGTIGGNLCQRPRCWYFRLENVQCLKRGGDTCYAKDGENKYNAVFGNDAPCVITHPSDLAPMLAAVDASVWVEHGDAASQGRKQSIVGLYRMPTADDPKRETTLADNEIITKIMIPPSPRNLKTTYLKFKERSSLDFAMASVAVAIEIGDDKVVRSARVVLGGVAPIPWPVDDADALLTGQPLTKEAIARVADRAVADAKPLSQNGYKLPLVRTLVQRALSKFA